MRDRRTCTFKRKHQLRFDSSICSGEPRENWQIIKKNIARKEYHGLQFSARESYIWNQPLCPHIYCCHWLDGCFIVITTLACAIAQLSVLEIIQSNHMSRLCQLPDAVILKLSTLVLAYTWKISTYLRTYWARSVATYLYWVHFWEISTIWSWSSLDCGKILAGLSILFWCPQTKRDLRLNSIQSKEASVWWI